ncbi:MAG: type II toxin-antitoxin system HicB family antitoxin [Candidatus Peregrinibacteria bacterium]|nr:type II toxin-antitoxin system HicB family antitoxin [Candidatus Peregrinibacteria bacterium]
MKTFSTIFFQDGDVWIGKALDLPGAVTQGKTLDEAKTNLEEAIVLVWETMQELNRRNLPRDKKVYRENIELALK